MLIPFRCSAGHLIAAPLAKAGKRARCPRCGLVVHVPIVEPAGDRTAGAAAEVPEQTLPSAAHRRPLPPARPATSSSGSATSANGSVTSANGSAVTSTKPTEKPAADRPVVARPKAELPSIDRTSAPESTNGSTAEPLELTVESASRSEGELSVAGPARFDPAASPGGAAKGTAAGGVPPLRRLPPPVPKRLLVENGAPAPLAEAPALSATSVSTPAASPAAEPAALGRSVAKWPKVATRLQGYSADIYRRQAVYWLGLGLALLCLFHLAPAFHYFDLSVAPGWARAVVILTLIELALVAWMVSVPDWSTVRVAMVVFAIVAALYGAALAIVVMTPRDVPIFLDLDEKRDAARLWCGAVVLLTGLMTYVAGSMGYKWRKAYLLGR
jgi:hypothetical protein